MTTCNNHSYCVVWSMSSNGSLPHDTILSLSSHQKLNKCEVYDDSFLKIYFLQRTLPLGFKELTTTFLLSNILQYSYYVISLSTEINWETTENHTFSSSLCQQCLWNACYLYHREVIRGSASPVQDPRFFSTQCFHFGYCPISSTREDVTEMWQEIFFP